MNENFKIKSETRFLAYKRDPRLDPNWGNTSSEDKFVNEIYNTYDGWVYWLYDYNEDPISYYQMSRLYFNTIYAQSLMYGWNHIKMVEDYNQLNLLGTDPYQLNLLGTDPYGMRNLIIPQMDGWDAEKAPMSTIRHLENIEKYASGGVFSRDLYKSVEYNSGVNITLVGFETAFFRHLLGYELRTEDYWYILPSLVWSKDNEGIYSLKEKYVPTYGRLQVRLVDNLPVAVGEDPVRYWVMTDRDELKKNDENKTDNEVLITSFSSITTFDDSEWTFDSDLDWSGSDNLSDNLMSSPYSSFETLPYDIVSSVTKKPADSDETTRKPTGVTNVTKVQYVTPQKSYKASRMMAQEGQDMICAYTAQCMQYSSMNTYESNTVTRSFSCARRSRALLTASLTWLGTSASLIQ